VWSLGGFYNLTGAASYNRLGIGALVGYIGPVALEATKD